MDINFSYKYEEGYLEMMYAYLQELKKQAGDPTNAQIAAMSGVPESTVAKMMSGTVDNPRFQNVVDVILSLGGSVDEFVGIVKQESSGVQIDNAIDAVDKSIHVDENSHPMDDSERQYYRDQIDQLKNEMLQREAAMRAEYLERERLLRAEARRRERWLFFWNCALMLFIMIVLLIDLTNPSMGYFRYTGRMIPDMQGFFNGIIPFI